MNVYIWKWLDIPTEYCLSRMQYIMAPSVKFTQCQTVLHHPLKEWQNDSLKDIWKLSSSHHHYHHHFISMFKFNKLKKYINNAPPTRKNMTRWGLSQSCDCSFYLNPESLLFTVTGCQHYLDGFTWRHDSILNFIANSLWPVINDGHLMLMSMVFWVIQL